MKIQVNTKVISLTDIPLLAKRQSKDVSSVYITEKQPSLYKEGCLR